MKFNQTLTDTVRRTIETDSIPMLLGEPGIGKSSWVIDLARQMGTKAFVLACNQLADKADLTGARLVPDGNNGYSQVFYPHQVINDAIAYANENPRETPILFMDEINRTTPDVTSAALSIPTLRSIGSVKLPENLRVVAAGNDKGNITTLDEASISRFVLFRTEPDVQTYLALDSELNVWVKNVLQAHPETIFGKTQVVETKDENEEENLYIDDYLDDGEEMQQITTPRTISAISRFLNATSHEALLALMAETRQTPDGDVSALQDILEGYVGKTNFSAYLLVEVMNGITANQDHQANIMQVAKPACYDELKGQTTMTELNEFVKTLNDKEKSESLVYLLYEKEDNQNYIESLAPQMTSFNDASLKLLMQLSATDKLDKENVQTFLKTQSNVANKLAIILES